MVLAMMDGCAWTVGELARAGGVSPQSGSEHVALLAETGLITQVRQGRHTYVTLAGDDVANAIEALNLIARTDAPTTDLRGQRADRELVEGRTCYRHLAGQLGVDLADQWRAAGLVTPAWELTEAGRDWFEGHGVDTRPDPRRGLLRPCIDWTQRRPHAAGPLADRFAEAAFAKGWIRRGTHRRAVAWTAHGRRACHIEIS